jgi:hypothetical protein
MSFLSRIPFRFVQALSYVMAIALGIFMTITLLLLAVADIELMAVR